MYQTNATRFGTDRMARLTMQRSLGVAAGFRSQELAPKPKLTKIGVRVCLSEARNTTPSPFMPRLSELSAACDIAADHSADPANDVIALLARALTRPLRWREPGHDVDPVAASRPHAHPFSYGYASYLRPMIRQPAMALTWPRPWLRDWPRC